jgi:SAM-dependent methyltransferase
VPLETDTFARSYEKLARFFIRPLVLVEHGSEHTARRLSEDPRDGVLPEDVGHLECGWAEWNVDGDRDEVLLFLEQLASEVESLSCRSSSDRWIDYFATDCDFGPGTSWTRKEDVLRTLLDDAGIRTVLDLGSNTGHYAQLAAQCGRQVFAADFDPALVDIIFGRTQEGGVSLYPLVLDFTHPTPGRGVAYRWFPPVTERIMSDLVLCFALEHHMVFGKYRLDFDQVACGVRNFSRTWALVEYVERGKIQPAEWRRDADGWYSVDEFARALGRYFRSVQILPPALDGRRLLLCGPHRRQL